MEKLGLPTTIEQTQSGLRLLVNTLKQHGSFLAAGIDDPVEELQPTDADLSDDVLNTTSAIMWRI